jgi:hypothetical protein
MYSNTNAYKVAKKQIKIKRIFPNLKHPNQEVVVPIEQRASNGKIITDKKIDQVFETNGVERIHKHWTLTRTFHDGTHDEIIIEKESPPDARIIFSKTRRVNTRKWHGSIYTSYYSDGRIVVDEPWWKTLHR